MSARFEADLRSLDLLLNVGTHCGLSDAELLERFLASADEVAEFAFEGLVVRHGPMVLDVCLKVLGDEHDAQDAFQATFLVLATRARSILKQRSVGSWLHGVALRVARRARSDAARRKFQERRIAEMTTADVEAEPVREQYDFLVLHEEVERLPRKYREPIVLCYLEGMTLETAASQLHCPIGTIGVRLMRARERLKARLSRRGVSPHDGFLIAGLSSRGASGILPDALIRSTAGAAVRLTSRGAVSLAAAKLTDEVLRSMVMIQLAKMSAAVLAVAIAVGSFGGGYLLHSQVLAEKRTVNERDEQVAPLRIGQKVVTKYETPLREGDRVLDDDWFHVYTIDQVDNDRVKLVSGDVSGWVQESEIVPFNKAIDFYTREIKDDPKNGQAYHRRGLIWDLNEEYEKAIADFTESIRLFPVASGPLIGRGNIFLNHKHEFDKAIADYDRAIQIDPECPSAYCGLGCAWNRKGDYDKAITNLDEAIGLDPKYANSYYERGLAWLRKGDRDKALPDLNEAIRLDPRAALAYNDRAAIWGESDYDKAMDDLDEAIKLKADYALAYKNRGGLWALRQNYERALGDYNESIRLDPNSALTYLSRGLVWYRKQDDNKAIADFTEAIRLDSKSALTYLNRGLVWYRKQDDNKAIADFTEAIRLDSKSALTYLNRGFVWARKQDDNKAIADFTEAIRLDSKSALTYLNRGLAWARKKSDDRAIADFTEAIRLGSAEAWTYNQRGRAWQNKGENDKAIADFTEAIRLAPNDAWPYANRGHAWYQKKEYDEAVADLTEAIRLDPRCIDAYYKRGLSWWAKKEYDKAIADFSLAIQLDPQYSDAYSGRGWAWIHKQEFEKAITDFNKAIEIDAQNPDGYSGRAWLWATSPDEKYRDGNKAVESATKACELVEWKVPSLLEILAAADAEAGEFDSAVKWQVKANELYTDAEDKTRGEAQLKLYQEKKPYRDETPQEDE